MSSSLTILMTCCAGFSACETSAPRARSLTAAMKARTTGQRDVGLEQRDADLARGGVDVGLGQPALAAQAGEDLVQAVGEGLEHSTSSEVTGADARPRHLTPGYRAPQRGAGARARSGAATTGAAPISSAVPQSAQAHSGHSPPSSVCPSAQGGCTNSRTLAARRAGPRAAVHADSSSRRRDRSVPVAPDGRTRHRQNRGPQPGVSCGHRRPRRPPVAAPRARRRPARAARRRPASPRGCTT